jgi:hypothetical protein
MKQPETASEILAYMIQNYPNGVKPCSNPAEIRRALGLLCGPGDTHELRALEAERGGTIRGYYRDLDAMAVAAVICTDSVYYPGHGNPRNGYKAVGTYFTLNPVLPDLWARAADKFKTYVGRNSGTGDEHIVKRRLGLIDFDCERPSGISSTDEEHDAAIALAREVKVFLNGRGWRLLLGDSGNGAHLVPRLDLPNDAESTELIKRLLKALSYAFGTDQIAVDETNFNAARISKIYGTVARKGSDLPERPHRVTQILEVDDPFEVVPREELEQLVEVLQPKPLKGEPVVVTPTSHQPYQPFDLDEFLQRHGIEVTEDGPYKGGRRLILAHCPWEATHTTKGTSDIAIIVDEKGPGYACQYHHCADKHWADYREFFEPGYRQRQHSRTAEFTIDGEPPAHPLWRAVPAAATPGSDDNDIPGDPENEVLRDNETITWGHSVWFKDVPKEDPEWLWKDHILIGKENLIVGDPGKGKSWASINLAAHVTTGTPFIDGSPCPKGSVMMIGVEDAVADTMRPRLEAQSGDTGAVCNFVIKSRTGKQPTVVKLFSLSDHLPLLRNEIKNLSVNNILMVEQARSVIWRDHAEASQTIAIMGSIGRIVGNC